MRTLVAEPREEEEGEARVDSEEEEEEDAPPTSFKVVGVSFEARQACALMTRVRVHTTQL